MKSLKETYKLHFKHGYFVWSLVVSFALLVVSLFVSFYAGVYATRVASQPVTDIILSNIRVFDVDGIFIYGPWVLWIFVATIVITRPYRIPFIVKSIALFVLIRSVFITLTHIGPFPNADIVTNTKLISDFTSGGDLFFSAHTGLPFLMALVFWNHKFFRYLFIATSVFFGIVVLLGHLHYSIDVLAAFFITYSIYHISEVFFKKEYDMFETGIPKNG